jgi:hypothetical protein
MVARTRTDQSAVVHGPSLPSQLTPTATPPLLEIRRRLSPAGGVRTRERQIRVLIGGPMDHLSRALATARIDDLHRDAARRHAVRLARSVKRGPRVAGASRLPILSGRRWTGRRDRRSRGELLPMHQEMGSERS